MMHKVLKEFSNFLLVLYYWLEGIVLTLVPRRLMYKDISEDIVLITGAGSGIGRLMAIRFAMRCSSVVLWDINAANNAETAELVQKEGGHAVCYQCDITDREAVYRTAAKVKDEVGIVSILVNNAGIVVGKNLMDIPDEMVEKTFHVNVISHFWLLKAFLPDMISHERGHLVTISSLAGLGGLAKLTDYCASKFAAVGLQESLTLELHTEGHKNIFTTTVCPFFINTGMFCGAQTSLFPMLDPDYVADQVLSAVLCNQELMLLPRPFYFLHTLKTILPAKSLIALHDALGGSSSMISFTGRKKKTT